jgi:hypothetical protein
MANSPRLEAAGSATGLAGAGDFNALVGTYGDADCRDLDR